MTDLLLQMAGALAFVTILIAAAAWAWRKKQPGAKGLIGLVAYHPFGPRRGVAAVRVGREILVLGVTNADLKLFRVLDAAEFEAGSGASVPDKAQRLRKWKEELDA
ncbi:MAG: flagellar biosynthetic protein FliO [Deltaproteobacteria bacterium]|nr:flagellar biosynthetic protein FliO [Deltaproteobacteria bacterium]